MICVKFYLRKMCEKSCVKSNIVFHTPQILLYWTNRPVKCATWITVSNSFCSTRIVKNLVKLLYVGYVVVGKNFTRTYFAPAGQEQRLLKLLLTIDAITAKITVKVINKKPFFLKLLLRTILRIHRNQLHSAKQFKINSDNGHLLKETC